VDGSAIVDVIVVDERRTDGGLVAAEEAVVEVVVEVI